MKPAQTLSLVTLTLALTATTGWSQSTPTGTATSTSIPQGAVAPDSTPTDNSQNNRQSGRRNRANRRAEQNSGRTGSATNTSTQESQYRQGSTANGTTVNSSNTTNYDVNSAVTAPTGAGSNPNNTGTTTPPNNNGSNNSISSGSSSGSSSSTSGRSSNSGKEVSATATAVTGARTSEKPAVKAGSTERNTSIHDYIASSPNHVTLQNALQSAGLYDMLKESGPYTLFAPTNAAFKKLPASAKAGLLEGRNRDALKQLLSYHVVQGTVDAAELGRRIKEGNGKATLQTLAGTSLTAQTGANGRVTLTDEQGKSVMVEDPDQYQANGVVHSISSVLMTKSGVDMFR